MSLTRFAGYNQTHQGGDSRAMLRAKNVTRFAGFVGILVTRFALGGGGRAMLRARKKFTRFALSNVAGRMLFYVQVHN